MAIQEQVVGRNSPFIVDIALEMQRKGLLDFFMDTWREYGDLSSIKIGPTRMYLVVHPDDIRHVMVTNASNYPKGRSYDVVRNLLLGDGLLTSNGELWRRQRRMMSPYFTPTSVTTFGDAIIETAHQTIQRWDSLSDAGTTIDMLDEMVRVTVTVILKALFSTTSDEDIHALRIHVEHMVAFSVDRTFNPISLPVWVPLKSHRTYAEARQKVLEYVKTLIDQRRGIPSESWPDDVLSRLMKTVDEETGDSIPDELLVDEVITMFIAGYETTAQTLMFTWYALSQNEDAADQLYTEVSAIIQPDNLPALDDFRQMPYTLQIVRETLRLYPPVIYARDTVKEDIINGMQIAPNSRIVLLPYATHRHPDFWDNPEQFDPSRWENRNQNERHQYAYHPFATGQRICIGINLALLETHIIVAMLARYFKPTLISGHVPQIVHKGTLTSANGMPMTLAKRS